MTLKTKKQRVLPPGKPTPCPLTSKFGWLHSVDPTTSMSRYGESDDDFASNHEKPPDKSAASL
jgi:hypothetical protein